MFSNNSKLHKFELQMIYALQGFYSTILTWILALLSDDLEAGVTLKLILTVSSVSSETSATLKRFLSLLTDV